MPQQPRSRRRLPVAHSILGSVEDPEMRLETNLVLPHRPSLISSLTPNRHLRLVIAQSQEQLVSQHCGLLPPLAKLRVRQPGCLSTSLEVVAKFRRSPLETGPRQPPPQPRRERQMPMPFVASAAVEAGPAAESLS